MSLRIKNILITFWVQIRDLWLYAVRHAIIVNGYVDNRTWRGIRHRNWGDDLNYYFISYITDRPVVFYHTFKIAKWFGLRNYLCIGTLLDAVNYSNRRTLVWGSGVSGQERDFVLPEKIYSVRGKKTIKFLSDRNIVCSESYGDPALLLPLFYRPKKNIKKYRLGIIPHVIDQEHSVIVDVKRSHPEIRIIDLANYSKWTDVIDEICSCECIASSSLHGLIVSDAYGVPNCWIELTGKIAGGYFKFYDYASSVDRELITPFIFNAISGIKRIEKECSMWTTPKIDMQSIIDACPFKIRYKTKR